MLIERIILANPINRGAVAGIVWAAYVVVSNLYQEHLGRPVALSLIESLLEAVVVCLMAWGVYRRSRVCAALLLLEIFASALSGGFLLGEYSVAVFSLPFLYLVGQAARDIFAHHKEYPAKASAVARLIAFSAGSAVVVAFAFLCVLLWDTPPTRIIPGKQLPATYLSELQSLDLVQADERVLFFYSPAFSEIREEMYALTESKLVAYGEEWASPAIISRFDEISEIEFEHDPSWMTDSILIVRLMDGTELFVPLSSEGGGDRRFHATLEELLGRARQKSDSE